MIERAKELLRELRENYDNSYWWLDHQGLRLVLLSIVSGVIALGFAYLEAKVKRAATA